MLLRSIGIALKGAYNIINKNNIYKNKKPRNYARLFYLGVFSMCYIILIIYLKCSKLRCREKITLTTGAVKHLVKFNKVIILLNVSFYMV